MIILDETLDKCPACECVFFAEYCGTKYGIDELPDLQYHKCDGCGLLFLNPRMGDEQLREFYKSDYRVYVEKFVPSYSPEQDEYRQMARASAIDRLLDKATVTSHLDIGCSRGELLHRISAPVQAGVEWNEEDADLCERCGIEMYDLDAIGIRFDLITVIQVLEHSNHPVQMIERLLPLLNKGGRLVIEVPNADYGHSQDLWHPMMFTDDTLRKTIEIAKGKVVRMFAYKGYRPVDEPYYIFAEVKNGNK